MSLHSSILSEAVWRASGASIHLLLSGGYFQGIKVLSSGKRSFPKPLHFLLTFHLECISSHQPMAFIWLISQKRKRGEDRWRMLCDLCQVWIQFHSLRKTFFNSLKHSRKHLTFWKICIIPSLQQTVRYDALRYRSLYVMKLFRFTGNVCFIHFWTFL